MSAKNRKLRDLEQPVVCYKPKSKAWFVVHTDGSESGPFKSYTEAKSKRRCDDV